MKAKKVDDYMLLPSLESWDGEEPFKEKYMARKKNSRELRQEAIKEFRSNLDKLSSGYWKVQFNVEQKYTNFYTKSVYYTTIEMMDDEQYYRNKISIHNDLNFLESLLEDAASMFRNMPFKPTSKMYDSRQLRPDLATFGSALDYRLKDINNLRQSIQELDSYFSDPIRDYRKKRYEQIKADMHMLSILNGEVNNALTEFYNHKTHYKSLHIQHRTTLPSPRILPKGDKENSIKFNGDWIINIPNEILEDYRSKFVNGIKSVGKYYRSLVFNMQYSNDNLYATEFPYKLDRMYNDLTNSFAITNSLPSLKDWMLKIIARLAFELYQMSPDYLSKVMTATLSDKIVGLARVK